MRAEKAEEEEQKKSPSILGQRNDERSIFCSKDSTVIVHSCIQITVLQQHRRNSNFFVDFSKQCLSLS